MRSILLARGSSIAIVALGVLIAAPVVAQQQPSPPPAAEPASPAAAAKAAQTAEQDAKADNAMHSTSGKAGKQEPGVSEPHQSDAGPVLLDGRWNVPGAPADSQTVPSKFSERNARLDKLPIMAFPLGLTDAQRQQIAARVGAADAPVATLGTKLSEELPMGVALNDLPQALNSEVPAVHGLKYVRTSDRVLLVAPSNRIVVGEVMISGSKG
jgi:hypothetical protein